MIKRIPETASVGAWINTRLGDVNPEEGCSGSMDIHGAAAAIIENEPPDREERWKKHWPVSYETTWPRVSAGDRSAVASALTPEGCHAQRGDFQGLT